MKEGIKELIRRWALSNAIRHEGAANTNAVVGKLIAEKPELKENIGEMTQSVEEEVKKINELSLDEQKNQLEELGAPERPEKEEEKGLPELPELDRYETIVTRFAPNPNGPLHLGHVRTALLSHEYARKHDGKFILRFEDTNPANARDEMYDLIRDDLKWLGVNWDEEYLQSNRLGKYYNYAEELLSEGKAYICTCKPSEFKELRDKSKPCQCRELDSEDQLERWQKMLNNHFKEGEAVVRIKTDLESSNPALRDWPALRISTSEHPRVGEEYRVWPLYNFSVSIDDHEMGVTHVIRGKEHEVNEKRQKQLFNHLNWDYPTAVHHGRLSISGVILSKTRVMEGIQEGKFDGFDDVRLGTVAAVRRRGFTPEAIKKSILKIGVTSVDSTLSMDTLSTENRRIIDEESNRYYFVKDPIELTVKETPEINEAKIRLHPDDSDRGNRVLPIDSDNGFITVKIPEKDFLDIEEGDVVRLKDLLNFKLISKNPPEAKFDSFEVIMDSTKIQWVSSGGVDTTVVRPDGSLDEGLSEPEVSKLEPGTIIQFERFGFVKLEETKPKIKAIYTHH